MPSETFRSTTTPSRGADQVMDERHLPGALDLVDDLGRDAEVLQAPPRALVADGRQVLRSGRVDLGRVQPQQGLALVDVVARGDVLDLLDEGVGAHRDDRDPALVLLDDCPGARTGIDRTRRSTDLRPHPGPLELARRDRDECRRQSSPS